MHIDNVYYNIGKDYDPVAFREDMKRHYREKERIRLIMDLDGQDVTFDAFKKLKKVFDDLGVEKLEETCVICKDGIKKTLIRQFIKLIPTKRPVIFV